MSSTTIDFPPFRLDLRAEQLTRAGTPIPLRPKTYAVLRYLAERPGALVTKRELLDAVWGGVAVTEDVVRLCAREVRAALGDDRTAPRFIETVPRRGYRFVARLADALPAERTQPMSGTHALPAHDWIVGREAERSEIASWLVAAQDGRRQIGFISGEVGIGKTTLVDVALRDLERTHGRYLRVARGHCVEHYGGGAPYLPVLEAIAALRREHDGADVDATLQRHAPDWLMRATGTSPRSPSDTTHAADTHEHTLQMLAACIAALAEQAFVVLVLEDVHWSDYSTLDLVSVLAQRREAARLLVLCTFRPADAIAGGHPVVAVERELLRKRLCREMALGGLDAAQLGRYLAARFASAPLPPELLPLLIERSDGNPFLATVLVDELLASGMLVESGAGLELRGGDALRTMVPDSLRAALEPQLDRLSADESRVLETASVAGNEFAAHAIAAVAGAGSALADVEVAEQLCDRLARRHHVLRECGEATWPDGTTSARYAFRHALYRQVVDRRLTPAQRRRLHQSIGERIEAAYGGRTQEVAGVLAAHFDASHDVARAIRYHGEAAAEAGSRHAYREVRYHLQSGVDLLGALPETPERLRIEIELLEQLGWTLIAIESWGSEEASRAFDRMRQLAERLDAPALRLRAMEGLRSGHTMRAEYASARAVCEATMALAEQLDDRKATGAAHVDLGSVLMHLGELEEAHRHARSAPPLVGRTGLHGISARVLLSGACAYLGRVAEAHAWSDDAVACSVDAGVPYWSAFAPMYAASSIVHLGDAARTRPLAAAGLRLAEERGFASLRIKASMLLGWCDAQEGRAEEGCAALRAGLADFLASGERISTTSWQTLLVGAYLARGDVASASALLDEAFAFVESTGERLLEHELHRLRGDCLLATAAGGHEEAAISHFERAIALAAERKASVFELRAAVSLLRVRGAVARDRVVRLVDRFTGENDCIDARAARAALRGR